MLRDLEFPSEVVVETFVETLSELSVLAFGYGLLIETFLALFLLEFANFQNCEFEFKNKSEVLFYGFLT